MKDDRVYLEHIRDSLLRVTRYTAGGHDAFLTDEKTQDAVVRSLDVVGEAAKRISSATRERAPTVQWKQITGMRDKLIHEYFGVNLEAVWQVVKRDGPALLAEVQRLLKSPGD